MNHRKTRSMPVAALLAGVTLAGLPGHALAQPLAAHRAIYDIALKDASDRSGIVGVRGRIVYEFQGSVCDGYTTTMRYVTRILSSSGDRLTDQQTSTYEDGSGHDFRFVTKSYVDEHLDKELSGSAKLTDDATEVTLKKPNEAEFVLEPSLFPTAHILDLLHRADQGQRIYETRMFDGSEDADRVMTTTVVVGPKETGTDGDGKNAGPLKDDPFRNVSISYFDESSEQPGESLPEYQIAFKLYDNGVTRDLVMDYGDFVLTGSMTGIEMLPQQSCN